jgi:hypothetical protein
MDTPHLAAAPSSGDSTPGTADTPHGPHPPAADGAPELPGTPPPPPESLADVLARLEGDPAPCDEHDFRGPLAALRRATEERGGQPAPALVAEEVAFTVHAQDHQGLSEWGLYFGPFMSGTSASGEPWEAPALAQVTPDVLAHWRGRAAATPHPVMRARYADLLWELPKKLAGARPDPTMARAAVDAYLDAVEGRRYEHEVIAVAKGERALTLALAVGDAGRVARARDVLIALEDAVAEDESPGLWGFCFDALLEPPNKKIPLSEAQRDQLVADMEARLTRFAGGPPDPYHPYGPERAALRLAAHYRRRGRPDDVARVLRTYGTVVERMRGTAAPLVAAHSLEVLHGHYTAFGLHADADGLHAAMREAGTEAVADMHEVSATVEVPREQADAYFAAMLAGTAPGVLQRVALHYLPRRAELEPQLRELARTAPISYLVTHTIKDADGRTVATVGPLDQDFEGHYVRHVGQHLAFWAVWLREAVRRGFYGGSDGGESSAGEGSDGPPAAPPPGAPLSEEAILDFLVASPCFPAERRALLAAGVSAYARGDAPVAIHLLVPQIEHAVRQLAVAVGAPLYTQRRGGGLHARTLDDLLRDEAVGAALGTAFGPALGADATAYLRILLTDARGWNVRNTVCHGLAPVATLRMPVADRVVHAALVLALLRWTAAGAEPRSEVDGTTGGGSDPDRRDDRGTACEESVPRTD